MWITSDNQIIQTPRGITIDGIKHPQTIFFCWSKEQLATIGIKPYHSGVCPAGHRVTGAYTEEIDGEVYERFNTEPMPEPEPVVTEGTTE